MHKLVALVIAFTLIPCASLADDFIATPSVVYESPFDDNLITSIEFNAMPVRAPGPVSVTVMTRTDVTTVELKVMGHRFTLTPQAVGAFVAQGDVPRLPFFLKRTYKSDITATLADGTQQTVTIPIAIK